MVQIEITERPLYEIANTYQMRSTDLLRVAREELKLPVKSHMSVLTAEQYEALVSYLEKKKKSAQAPQSKSPSKSKPSSQKKALSHPPVIRKSVKAAATTISEKRSPSRNTAVPSTEPPKVSVDVRRAMRDSEQVKAGTSQKERDENSPRLSKKTIVRKSPSMVDIAAQAASDQEQTSIASQSGGEQQRPFGSDSAVIIAQPNADAQILGRLQPRRPSISKAGLPEEPSDESISEKKPLGHKVGGLGEGAEEELKGPAKKTSKQLVQKTEVFRPVDYLKREQIFRTKRKRISRTSGLMSATSITMPAAHKRVVEFKKPITVKDLAYQMKIKAQDLLAKLRLMGSAVDSIDQKLDFDTVSLIAQEYKFEASDKIFTEERFFQELVSRVSDPDFQPRPPVVTVMGHVDHGKTTLLDSLRKTAVAKGEAGGITQHVGAYHVELKHKAITFIDTPGHAAFTAMRRRGAALTDIVILVVAADDGLMPQTREAIEHAKAANVPIIVAVNKMDLPGANVDKVRNQLSEQALVSEEWGGDTMFVPTSALKGEGLDKLCESILVLAEVNEIKGSKKLYPSGVVVESRLDKTSGPLVTLIVTQGVFKVGQNIISGTVIGRVRQMRDENGKPLTEVGPGLPVGISGLSDIVPAGVRVDALPTAKDVDELLEYRLSHAHELKTGAEAPPEATMEELMSRIGELKEKKVYFVIKADVKGSEEALRGVVEGIHAEGAPEVKVVLSGCGSVTESDVDLAKTTGATVVAFHTKVDGVVRKLIEDSGLTLIESNIIYEIAETITKIVQSGKAPEFVTEELGVIEVRQLFKAAKAVIAGCYVKEGKVTRGALVRVKRAGKLLGTGKITSLKRFKDDAREVEAGYECGIAIDFEAELQEGDVFEAYHQVEKKAVV